MGFQKNVNNFRKDEAILTKFHQLTPGTNCYRPHGSQMHNFQNSRWRTPPSWIYQNLNNFCTDEAVLTKFHRRTLDTNCRRPDW